MSDDLPTPERLARIRLGVDRRIDLRRRIARRVAGGSVAVLLVAGGFALLPHLTLTSAGGSSAAGGSAAEAPSVAVTCHAGRTTVVHVDRAGLPASAIAACGNSELSATQAHADTGSAPTPSPSSSLRPAAALCRAEDGALHVWPAASGTCESHGMEPFAG